MNQVVDNTYKKISLFFIALSAILYYPMTLFFSGKWEVRSFVKLYSTEQLKMQFPDFSQSSNGSQLIEFMIQNALDPLGFRYYSLCLFVGLIFGFWLMLKFLPRIGVKIGQIERMFVELLLLGLFGARIGYIAGHFQYFVNKPLEALNLQQGGLSLFGGLVICFVYLIYANSKLKTGLFTLIDHLVPATLSVMIFSRFGNFFNYESYGGRTNAPWKMFVPEGAINNNRYNIPLEGPNFYHPAFLYELIPNILLLVILTFIMSKFQNLKSGIVTGIFCVGYGIIRFVVEFFRLDSQTTGINLTVGQIITIVIIMLGIILIIKKPKPYAFVNL
jgi:phosphatidylglycerol---prolipoprotein diacylglyceryl transferase